MSGTSNPVAVSGREVGRSSFRDLRSEPRGSDSPFSLLAPSFLSLLAVPRSSPGTFKEVNIHRLLLPFLQHPIQSLSCVLRSFPVCLLFSISVSLSLFPPLSPLLFLSRSILRHPFLFLSHPRSRLVTTSSGTPFLRKTRSSTGIAARLKGQFRNFHPMASIESLFSAR